MIRKYLLPLLAVAGFVFALYTVGQGKKSLEVPPAAPVAQPADAPYASYIAGAGIVEASSENIQIGAPVPGIVLELYVKAGDEVTTGQALFKVDDRELQAQLLTQQATVRVAKEQIARLEKLPRPEDVPAAEARLKSAQGALADAQSQLRLAQSVSDKRALSTEELNRRRFAVEQAEGKAAEAKASLALLKAGAWKPELEIARAELAQAQSQIKATQIEIERHTVRAPVAGEILQNNVRLGQFAPTGALATPLMLLGNVSRLHVRTDIDENDAWRFRPGARAIAYVRGNRQIKVELAYVRTEPFIVPKRSLTGESTERVDTRVMQALFAFAREDKPIYVGQLMDVFIEAPPVGVETTVGQGGS